LFLALAQHAAMSTPSGQPTRFLLIRHAESHWNVWRRGVEDPRAADPSEGLFDAMITERGREQAHQLRASLHGMLQGVAPDLILSSPLTRALETALLVFGDHHDAALAWRFRDDDDDDKLPRIELAPEVRELLEDTCDIGSSAIELKTRFPSISGHQFEQYLQPADRWYLPPRLREHPLFVDHESSHAESMPEAAADEHEDSRTAQERRRQRRHWELVRTLGRESDDEVAQRLAAFRERLRSLEGRYSTVVVFGHGTFFWHLTARKVVQLDGEAESFGTYLDNCEVLEFSL